MHLPPRPLATRLRSEESLWGAVAALALVPLLAGCPKPGSGTEPLPDAGTAGCSLSLTYRPQASASRVGVMGEWNGFDRLAHVMKDPDGDGTYSAELKVPPGTWAYSFLENGAEVSDPEARYMRHRQGRPTSAVRVADCSAPGLEVRKETLIRRRSGPGTGELTVVLRVIPPVGSTDPVRLEATLRTPADRLGSGQELRKLTAAELALSSDGTSATLALANLQDGKHTLSVRAWAGEKASAPLLLPFWVEAEPFSYRDTPIYMVVTDRFRDGDPSNNPLPLSSVPVSARFQGGDFQGLEQAIREGYFDAMGVKALWLTPWQTQPQGGFPSDDGREVLGYHGYWPVKAREVDPRFGGRQALYRLVEEAHRHGIRIIMDAVLNHVHRQHEYFVDPAKKDWFRTACKCGSSDACGWDNARLTCLFNDYMPDVNWTNDAAADQFVADTLWWMEEFDLDGIRLDAVKHIEDAAFTNLTSAVRDRFEQADTDYYMFGETFSDNLGLIKQYIGPRALDGQLNFPLFFQVPVQVFGRDDNGLQLVRDATQRNLADFGDAMMVNFVGSHDVARFITKADPAHRDREGSKWENLPGAPVGHLPYDRLYLAMVHLMTTPGVPLLYYGDEYGEFGASDPDNRHFLNREPNLWDPQRRQLDRMRALLTARAGLRGLRRGPLLDLWCNDEPWGKGKGNLYAYARPDPDPGQAAVVVLNLTETVWGNVGLRFPVQVGWTAGTLRDALSGREYAFSNSSVNVDVPARGAVVLHLK